MAEYINREEAIHAALSIIESSLSFLRDAAPASMKQEIGSIHAADVQPVLEYGGWTAEGNDEYGNYWDECTACRKAVWFPPFVKNDYKYCPHCGARMDGEE